MPNCCPPLPLPRRAVGELAAVVAAVAAALAAGPCSSGRPCCGRRSGAGRHVKVLTLKAAVAAAFGFVFAALRLVLLPATGDRPHIQVQVDQPAVIVLVRVRGVARQVVFAAAARCLLLVLAAKRLPPSGGRASTSQPAGVEGGWGCVLAPTGGSIAVS